MNHYLFLQFLLAFLISWSLFKLLIPQLALRIIDKPVERSSHYVPKPNGGGIIFLLVLIPYSILYKTYLPLLCLPLSIVGFLDDLFKIPALIRYLFQIGTTLALINQTNMLVIIKNFDSSILLIISLFFLCLLGTAIINFINFMDGIDGIIAGNMAIIFLFVGYFISPFGYFITAILLGFLYWNWYPSKVFMGDVGSTLLGSLFVAFLFESASFNTSLSLILIASPILADAFFTVIRRFMYKKNIFSAHNSHLYQNGYSHGIISIGYILSVFILIICKIFFGINILILAAIIMLFVGAFFDNKFAKSFS